MRDEVLDELARRLARPMPRRHALRLLGGTVAGLWLGGLRPVSALAQDRDCTGMKICVPGSKNCFTVCCPPDRICCYAPPDPASLSGCVQNPHCCDPCNPKEAKCFGDGYCGPGPVAKNCIDDCKKRVDNFLRDYSRKVCRGSGKSQSVASLGEKSFSTFGCLILTESTLRPNRYSQCEADPRSNYTSPPEEPVSDGDLRYFANTAGANYAELRSVLRSADARQVALVNRVFASAARDVDALRRPALARDVRAYAVSVNVLKQRVMRTPAPNAAQRRARSLTASALGESNRALLLYARAVDSRTIAASRSNAKRAGAAMTRAAQRAREARAALGCGATCS